MNDLLAKYNSIRYMYEKIYDIKICDRSDIDDVVKFIDEHWQQGHILTKSKELLEWQHYDRLNDRYNFIIARNKNDNQIHGIIGFILSSIFDYEISTPIRWGAIWKVRNDVAVKGLGVALKGYMEESVPSDYIGGTGLTEDSKRIDKKLGEKMGKLSQYYIVNPSFKSYLLIENPELPQLSGMSQTSMCQLADISENDFESVVQNLKEYIMPYKSVKYYINRYYRHPIYKYRILGIMTPQETIEAILVCRKCKAEGRSQIFVVDFFGKQKSLVGMCSHFVDFLKKEDAEYISFPCTGIEDDLMKKAGFCLRDETDVVLPVYFEPFVRKNVDLDYHFWSRNDFEKPIIVKGDADQDRPNMVPEVFDD